MRLSIVTLWVVLPFALVLLIAIRRSLYLDRVFLDATFGLYLLLGTALSATARRLRSLPLTLGLTLFGVAGLPGLVIAATSVTNPDWRSATHDFLSAYRPGQAVIFYPAALRPVAAAYLLPHWHASREQPIWLHSYLDVPGWQKRYAGASDDDIRSRQLAAVTAGTRQVWLLTQDYSGMPVVRHWLATHGFHLLLSQMYDEHARIELWDRLLPPNLGPPVIGTNAFGAGWKRQGSITLHHGVAVSRGRTGLSRSFLVVPGVAYVVTVEYRCAPPAYPTVFVQIYDRMRRSTQDDADPFGTREDRFPRSKWYNWPATGVWLSQPFGFIAPPLAARATLQLGTGWGTCSWRHVTVYREPKQQA